MTEPHLRELPARQYVGSRSSVTMEALPGTVDRGFRELFARAGAPAGPPFIRYHAFEPELDVELGVPVSEGELELPTGTYAVLEYFGAYEGLRDAHVEVREWAGRRGLTLGDAVETYVTDPRAEPDASSAGPTSPTSWWELRRPPARSGGRGLARRRRGDDHAPGALADPRESP